MSMQIYKRLQFDLVEYRGLQRGLSLVGWVVDLDYSSSHV